MITKSFNIYAGLGGGFGGAEYCFTESYETEEAALEEACEAAIQEYKSMEGYHGLPSFENIIDDYCEKNHMDEINLEDADWGEIESIYGEEIESWIDFYVIPSEEDENNPV